MFAGLEPAIHGTLPLCMDARVKPGHDQPTAVARVNRPFTIMAPDQGGCVSDARCRLRRQPGGSFRDRSRHAPHWISPRRDRSHDSSPHGMLGADVRPVCARATVAAVAAKRAIRIGPKRRRCEHRAGQTCQTPCSLTLAVESQSVTFAKNGFLPQTIAISVDQPPPEHSFFSKTPPPTHAKPDQSGAPDRTAPQPVLQVTPQPVPLLTRPRRRRVRSYPGFRVDR